MEEIERNLNDIFELFEKFGNDDYLGEPVSKTVHSLQCGLLAEREGAEDALILGAFFHDIGHLVGERDGAKSMIFEGTNLGASNHGGLGADYLNEKGFDNGVTDYVRAHVVAKRYLCWKDPSYYENLSWSSKRTLEFQGGPMNDREGKKFESDPRCQNFVRLRFWDEQAKDDNWTDLKPLTFFKDLSKRYLMEKQKIAQINLSNQ